MRIRRLCARRSLGSTASPPPRVRSTRFAHGPLGRVFSYGSFFLSCFSRGLTIARPDLVITLTTPPLLSLIGNALKLLRGARHFMWEMDLYPDVAVDLAENWADGTLIQPVARNQADSRLTLLYSGISAWRMILPQSLPLWKS